MPDLKQWMGVDVGDRELLRSRSWPWLQDLIVGLIAGDAHPPSRLAALLNPPPAQHQ